ncbi:hypothetical protein [Mangrovibrevibacter kandeliae]|uniref:hypothetical protein n=1 Tax=Mangrovibrevibacter kandeliae TaxID=2968473 RepID=UPI0021189657|nr:MULTISPECIES: hypothetical protein [unclassified Aurantimonas]MCQ8781806.1 hypothetical protein [Aurantimonas sp. CSK15Z-1]MCW4115537.1 hypothetical protein [Aurantimonas sp. MSK8Z-1]
MSSLKAYASRQRAALAGLAVLASTLGAAVPAGAAPAAGKVAADAGATQAKPGVTGFRSARFGMDEKAVRAAIRSDFGVDDKAITKTANPTERTEVLSVKVNDVLKDGGTALVSYVLGYQSKALSQVSVLWAPETDAGIGPEKLIADAKILQNYFLGQGFASGSVLVNAAVPEGVVMFRGTDEEGRMALLLMLASATKPAVADKAAASAATNEAAVPQPDAEQTVLAPVGLLLSYLADPQDPDIFKVEPGQF